MSKETIALFGATGDTGSQVVKFGLEQGFHIKALARTPSKISVQDPNLTVIQGDFENTQAIKAVLKGANYVIVCAGGNVKVKKYVPIMEKFITTQLWPAMIVETSVKVFLYQAGALSVEPGKTLPMSMKLMKSMADCFMRLSPMVADNDAVISFIDSQTKTPFKVIVTRPGGIKKGDPTKSGLEASDSPSMSTMVTFPDLALFNLKAIKDESLYGKYPYVVTA